MSAFVTITQVFIAVAIFNVWLLRYGKATDYRGGNARSLKEEFAVYGLPGWFMGVVGFLKLLFAVLLIAGIWFSPLKKPAAAGMAMLMLGADILIPKRPLKAAQLRCHPITTRGKFWEATYLA